MKKFLLSLTVIIANTLVAFATDFKLVTDVSSLKAGDEVIIVNDAGTYALSTTQNDNNRGQAQVSSSNGLISLSDNQTTVQVITLASTGDTSHPFALSVGKGCLYHPNASTKNYLRTTESTPFDSDYKVKIYTENNVTHIAFTGNTTYEIKYNSSSKIFAAYSSGQGAVKIYKKETSGEQNSKIAVSLSFERSADKLNLGDSFISPRLLIKDKDGNDVAEALNYITYSVVGDILSIYENGNICADTSKVGKATLTAKLIENDEYSASEDAVYTLTVVDPNVVTYTDVLTLSSFGLSSGASYTSKTYASKVSGIIYSANIGGGNNAMQMNTTSGNCIAVTKNDKGYIVESVSIELNSNTVKSRTVNLYGREGVFTSRENVNTEGTSFYSFNSTNSYSGEINKIAKAYNALAVVASGGALYIDKITVVWKEAPAPKTAKPKIVWNDAQEFGFTCETEGAKIYYSTDGSAPTEPYTPGSFVELPYGPAKTYKIKAIARDANDENPSDEYSIDEEMPVIVSSIEDMLKAYYPSKNEVLLRANSQVFFAPSADKFYITDGKRNAYVELVEGSAKVDDFIRTVFGIHNNGKITSAFITSGEEGADVVKHNLKDYAQVAELNDYDLVYVENASIEEGYIVLGENRIAIDNRHNITIPQFDFYNIEGLYYKDSSDNDLSHIILKSVSEGQGNREEISIEFAEEVVNLIYDEEYEGQTPTLSQDVDLVWSSSDENVAIFEDDVLILGDVGTTVITASVKDTKNYTGSASYTINIAPKPVDLSFGEVETIYMLPDDATDFPTLARSEEVNLKFTSSDEYVATADLSGIVSGNVGEAVITVTPESSNYSGSASFTVKVMELPKITVTAGGKTYEDCEVFDVANGTEFSISAPGAYKITLEVDEADVVTHNCDSFTWTPEPGTYGMVMFTAYNEVGDASFALEGTVKEGAIVGLVPVDFIFTGDEANVAELASKTIVANSSTDEKESNNLDGVTLTKDDVKVTFAKAKSTTRPAWFTSKSGETEYTELRLYKAAKNESFGCTMKIESPSAEVAIERIVFTQGLGGKWNLTLTDNQAGTLNGYTWTPNATDGVVTSVTFASNSSDRTDIAEIRVIYRGELPDAKLVGFSHDDPEVGDEDLTLNYTLHVDCHSDARDSYKVRINLYKKNETEIFRSEEFDSHSSVAFAPSMRRALALNPSTSKATHQLSGTAYIDGLPQKESFTATAQVSINGGDYSEALPIRADISTSIDEISASDGEELWYDLSGRRVAAPGKGIFVKKYGNAVTKHMMR